MKSVSEDLESRRKSRSLGKQKCKISVSLCSKGFKENTFNCQRCKIKLKKQHQFDTILLTDKSLYFFIGPPMGLELTPVTPKDAQLITAI